jgi:hypothetical protein
MNFSASILWNNAQINAFLDAFENRHLNATILKSLTEYAVLPGARRQ